MPGKRSLLSLLGPSAVLRAALVAGLACSMCARAADEGGARPPYRSPHDLAFSPDGKFLAVSDKTAGSVVILNLADGKVAHDVKLNGKPVSVCWSQDGGSIYVAEQEAGTVAEVDAQAGKVKRRLPAGSWPTGVCLAAKKNFLIATDFAKSNVSVLDLGTGGEKALVPAVFMPWYAAVTPDETMAIVGNSLPSGTATNPSIACAVSLIDLQTMKKIADIPLLPGSINVSAVAVSPDGKWAYVVHNLGRFTLPTTQLERGWVNTDAVTIVDLVKKERYVTVLLDLLSRGAANPWGAGLSPDGKTLWVSLSGVHQIARVDVGKLHDLLAAKPTAGATNAPIPSYAAVWQQIKTDPKNREILSYDLAALYTAGILTRTDLPGEGPRGVAVSPDGKQVAIAMYFSGDVILFDAETGKVARKIAVGTQPETDKVRLGNMVFHDARKCFQHWLSCATCHPHEGRTDGLNWDLLNDGIGNPKNSKSLLLSHKTPPVMSHGVRANMEAAALAGFRFILFREPEAGEHDAVVAYIESLKPAKSPYLVNGDLSEKAKKGKKVFEDPKTGCAACHPAPLFTDLKSYDVGTRHELDNDGVFDNPTLIELWLTPPYLHDGSAATLKDVLTAQNKGDKHGVTSHLSEADIEALVEYLLSL